MITIEDLMVFWPVILAVVVVAVAWGISQARIRANEEKAGQAGTAAASVKRLLFKEDGGLIYFKADQAAELKQELKGDIKNLKETALTKTDHETLCKLHLMEFSEEIVAKIKSSIQIDEKALARELVKALKE